MHPEGLLASCPVLQWWVRWFVRTDWTSQRFSFLSLPSLAAKSISHLFQSLRQTPGARKGLLEQVASKLSTEGWKGRWLCAKKAENLSLLTQVLLKASFQLIFPPIHEQGIKEPHFVHGIQTA